MSDVKRLEKQFSSIFAGRRASLSLARNVGHKYAENLLRGTYSLQRAKRRDIKAVLEFSPLFLQKLYRKKIMLDGNNRTTELCMQSSHFRLFRKEKTQKCSINTYK